MRHLDPSPDQIRGFQDWMATRPASIRRDCAHLDPWTVYELKHTRQRVVVLSMSEPGDGAERCTVRVGVPEQFNTDLGHLVLDGISVFGIDPSDLAPFNG